MKRIMLNTLERRMTPCLFVHHWSVEHCDHAICGNWVSRGVYEQKKADRVNHES